MDFSNYKIVQKDNIDIAQDQITNDILKQIGFEKYYILGSINILKTLIDVMGKNEEIYKEDLFNFLESGFKDYKWATDIINAIINKYKK